MRTPQKGMYDDVDVDVDVVVDAARGSGGGDAGGGDGCVMTWIDEMACFFGICDGDVRMRCYHVMSSLLCF